MVDQNWHSIHSRIANVAHGLERIYNFSLLYKLQTNNFITYQKSFVFVLLTNIICWCHLLKFTTGSTVHSIIFDRLWIYLNFFLSQSVTSFKSFRFVVQYTTWWDECDEHLFSVYKIFRKILKKWLCHHQYKM